MSTAINPTHTSVPAPSRASSIAANHSSHIDSPYANGHHHHHNHDIGGGSSAAANTTKKGKQKKATDPNEASKLIAAKISQLELDAAGEKDQEAEIEREVKKANRELNNLTSKMDDLQKIETLQKRVTEHLADMKRLERDNQKNKKRGDILQKEKDHSRSELSKSVTLREKLEKLCRELQRENNRLKGENKTLQDSEKTNHAAWDDKFKQLLWQLQDYQDTKDHPQAQVVNIEIEELFKQRFKSLIDQYELRELHFHSLLRSKELEVQYHMARFGKEQKAAEAEVTRSRALNAQVLTFSKTESELRSQLNIYVEKFKQVEDTLNNSNDLFLTFRKEMEEMSKKTKRLEKENLTLTRKHDLTARNILEMAEERTKNAQDIEALKRKNDTLNNIIKQMQQQGRGVPEGMAGMVEGVSEDEEGEGDTESEYDYDDEEGEDGEQVEEGEYDEDTEEELHPEVPKTFGPAPPPTNGVTAINGIKH
ncbi:Alpha-taxilin [Hyphodiscus hymeniophilus]|uniref:Alpha-taxilin n=1 Tax=Hyphodiscus hymeniophilus TaxID=353542 RepID=A0A9P6SJX6_9HELO|nr:Alpha-taxilin [Hyphodiscus hymeniophilus]